MKQVMPKPLSSNPSQLFSYQLPKIYLHFQNKKSLIKPDRFDFNSTPLLSFYNYTPSTILLFLLTCF